MKLLFIAFTALTLSLTGCKKEEKAAPAPKTETTATAAADAGSATGAATGATAVEADTRTDVDPNADYIRILASHANPKPDDPVIVSVTRFQVVNADFDPQKVEGGKAVIELDLTSLESGSAKRDKHIGSPDYLDSAQFAKATITVDNVKKTGENAFSADATVDVRGQKKTLPVTFSVLERTADAIRIKGSHTFARHEFGIGKPAGQDDSVAKDLTIELQLTIKRTT